MLSTGVDEECGVGNVDERRTMYVVAAQAHHTPSTKAHSAGTHRKGTHRKYTQREHGKRKRAQCKLGTNAHTAGTCNARMGGASAHNASVHSASTKHRPAHPSDVDDFDERTI